MVTADNVMVADVTTPEDVVLGMRTIRGELRLCCDIRVSEQQARDSLGGAALAYAEGKIRYTIMAELYGELAEVHAVLSLAIAMMRPRSMPYPGDPVDAALATLKGHVDTIYQSAQAPAAGGGA